MDESFIESGQIPPDLARKCLEAFGTTPKLAEQSHQMLHQCPPLTSEDYRVIAQLLFQAECEFEEHMDQALTLRIIATVYLRYLGHLEK